MRGIAAAAGIAVLAGFAAAAVPFTFDEVLADFEVRVASYLEDTPEVPGDKEVARDRKALMKALAGIDRVQKKPSPSAIAKAIAKHDKALAKEIPDAEMAAHLDQVALNLVEAAGGAIAGLRDAIEALPPQPAREALLALADDLEADLGEASVLATRGERLKALGKLAGAHARLTKKHAGLVKRQQGVTYLKAMVNGVLFEDSSVFGTMILDPVTGGVVSLIFTASEPNGPDQESMLFSASTENTGGFLVPGSYQFAAVTPVAEVIYSLTDPLGSPVTTILGESGFLVIDTIDKVKGNLTGSFYFSGLGGTVTEGTFFLTGLAVIAPPI